MNDLQVVVGETYGAVGQRRDDSDPDETVAEISPEQGRNQGGDDNEHSAHGGSTRLALMGLGTVFAYVLADLEIAQTAHDGRPDDKTDEEGGKTGEGRAKGQIAEDSERADMKYDEALLIKQPVEQITPRR